MNTNTQVVITGPLWRVQILRVIQILGLLLMALGSAELTGLLQVMPTEWGKWVLTAGPILMSLKPAIQVMGDWADDGIKNDSFKFPMFLATLAVASLILSVSLPLVSCNQFGVSLTHEDGYLTITKRQKDGTSYSYGTLLDRKGHVLVYRIQWQTKDGVKVRYYHNNLNDTSIYHYQLEDGTWAEWSDKSGIVVGEPPGEVI